MVYYHHLPHKIHIISPSTSSLLAVCVYSCQTQPQFRPPENTHTWLHRVVSISAIKLQYDTECQQYYKLCMSETEDMAAPCLYVIYALARPTGINWSLQFHTVHLYGLHNKLLLQKAKGFTMSEDCGVHYKSPDPLSKHAFSLGLFSNITKKDKWCLFFFFFLDVFVGGVLMEISTRAPYRLKSPLH